MTSRLPLLTEHERAHSYCVHCAKMCRHVCPVSTVQARETTTPWGKMSSLHHVAKGHLPMEADHAATWYECTGCLRCAAHCKHDTDVASALRAGRAESVRTQAAPAAALSVVASHIKREARARESAEELFGDRMSRPSPTVFVPGCTALVTATEEARATLMAVDMFGGQPARVEARHCCGLPLLSAGDPAGFQRAARRFAQTISDGQRVVFEDPGCLHALRVLARLDGGLLPPSSHISELAMSSLGRLTPVDVKGPVRYHDACRLGRGLGIYEAPRVVLRHLIGHGPKELASNREHAECSGAGGLLPLTDPETATAIAAERKAEHDRLGGGTLISACPAARRAFSKRGIEAVSLGTLLSRSLAGGGTKRAPGS